MKRLFGLTIATEHVWLRSSLGPGLGRGRQARRAQRHVEPLRRCLRQGRRSRRADGGGGLWRQGARRTDRDHLRRPSEQARYRRRHCAPMDRYRPCRCHRRCADVVRGAGDPGNHAREEADFPDVGAGIFGPDRQGLLALWLPVDLRHLRTRPRHRRRPGQTRR